MSLHRIKSITYEASLLLGDLGAMLAACAACKLLGGHTEPEWQKMSTGRIGKCARCDYTIVVET